MLYKLPTDYQLRDLNKKIAPVLSHTQSVACLRITERSYYAHDTFSICQTRLAGISKMDGLYIAYKRNRNLHDILIEVVFPNPNLLHLVIPQNMKNCSKHIWISRKLHFQSRHQKTFQQKKPLVSVNKKP